MIIDYKNILQKLNFKKEIQSNIHLNYPLFREVSLLYFLLQVIYNPLLEYLYKHLCFQNENDNLGEKNKKEQLWKQQLP